MAIALVAALAGCGDSAGGASGNNDEDAAKKALQELLQRPTDAPVTEPIDADIPSGKTIDFISCGVSECNAEGDLIKGYLEPLGWDLNVINTDGTPESQRNAFEQVVRDAPDGVIYVSINRETYSSFLPDLEANGTFTASICSADQQGDGIDYANCTPELQGESGASAATWVAADNESGAGSVWINVPAFPTLADMGSNFEETLKKYCPDCAYDQVDLAVGDLADASQKIVSYLRSHSEVKYVGLGLDSLAAGLPAALKAAGLNDVKIVGAGTGPTNLQYLATGDEQASAPFPYYEVFGSAVDAIIRNVVGVDQVEAKYPEAWLLTKDNVDEVPSDGALFPMVEDIEDQFFELWGVSS
jgi:ribose transport system substrate-binding protein